MLVEVCYICQKEVFSSQRTEGKKMKKKKIEKYYRENHQRGGISETSHPFESLTQRVSLSRVTSLKLAKKKVGGQSKDEWGHACF